jgi:hypothetical protein
MYLIEISWGGVHWTDLAQDRDKWWPIVKEKMNFQVL